MPFQIAGRSERHDVKGIKHRAARSDSPAVTGSGRISSGQITTSPAGVNHEHRKKRKLPGPGHSVEIPGNPGPLPVPAYAGGGLGRTDVLHQFVASGILAMAWEWDESFLSMPTSARVGRSSSGGSAKVPPVSRSALPSAPGSSAQKQGRPEGRPRIQHSFRVHLRVESTKRRSNAGHSSGFTAGFTTGLNPANDPKKRHRETLSGHSVAEGHFYTQGVTGSSPVPPIFLI